MCIILTCDRNVRPDHDLIETCFWNNPDGAGIMWVEDGRVQTSKGFMDERSLERAIDAVPTDSPLVIHMRIATSGGIDVGTCHPFPVCRDLETLHAANVECRAAVAHNGVILGEPTDDKLGVSDTVHFVSHAIADMWRKDNRVTRKMRRKLTNKAPHNRFAILTEDGRVYRVGDGWESVSKGIQASNDSWRYSKSKWYGLRDSCWDNWSLYDYYWDTDEVEADATPDKVWDRYDVNPDYAKVIDRWCHDCECAKHCKVFGALCDDIAELADWELYGVEWDE